MGSKHRKQHSLSKTCHAQHLVCLFLPFFKWIIPIASLPVLLSPHQPSCLNPVSRTNLIPYAFTYSWFIWMSYNSVSFQNKDGCHSLLCMCDCKWILLLFLLTFAQDNKNARRKKSLICRFLIEIFHKGFSYHICRLLQKWCLLSSMETTTG